MGKNNGLPAFTKVTGGQATDVRDAGETETHRECYRKGLLLFLRLCYRRGR